MADISDVEQALADNLTALLYPHGSSQASIVSVTCRIYRGWPNAATLNSDLSAGTVNVTVVPDKDSGRTTTRYLTEWQFQSVQSGLVADASGTTVLVSGTPEVGDVVGMLVDGVAYVYRVAAGDSTNLVAANLCSAVQANRFATVSGPYINIPGAKAIKVRVVRDNNTSCEGRRQEKDLRVICWCSTPSTRDTIAGTIDNAVAQSSFLQLPDGTSARITYRNSSTFDQSQNALLYRRDLVYCVEYPTVVSVALPSMLFGAAAINGQTTFG